MKKMFSIALLLVVTIVAVTAAKVLSKRDVTGEWKYEVTTAPEGYQKGVITFTENKKVLEGEVTLDSGYKIQLRSIAIEGDSLKMGLFIESEYINVIVKITGGKMEGTVDSSQGKMILKAEKKSLVN